MSSLFTCPAEALAAAEGTEYAVVKLAPLSRFILVTRSDCATLAVPCGWEIVRA